MTEIRDREQAALAAEASNFNTPGFCQLWTRQMFNAPSAGDFDGDGAADAEDGWKREPISARRLDRNPPRGVPVSFLGGKNDNGHRAVSIGGGKFRSTDWDTKTQSYKAGVVGTANSLEALERGMGVQYVGWSTTINGWAIPMPPPEPFDSRGKNVDRALWRLKQAVGKGKRKEKIDKAISVLKSIKPFTYKKK